MALNCFYTRLKDDFYSILHLKFFLPRPQSAGVTRFFARSPETSVRPTDIAKAEDTTKLETERLVLPEAEKSIPENNTQELIFAIQEGGEIARSKIRPQSAIVRSSVTENKSQPF